MKHINNYIEKILKKVKYRKRDCEIRKNVIKSEKFFFYKKKQDEKNLKEYQKIFSIKEVI